MDRSEDRAWRAKLAALCVVTLALPSLAAEPSADAGLELRPIEEIDLESLLDLPTVTASGGREQKRSLAAASVTVVTREEIGLHGWRSLAEVFASTLGFYLIDDLVHPSVGVRGVTGGLSTGTRIIKVMINGVPVSFRPDLNA
ncbi:MAG: TonB-dependent receptor plug domain-containing protein, partial [Myxococcaceae bacterium]